MGRRRGQLLRGGPVGDELHLLCRTHNAAEAEAVYRMRFSELARDSLTWAWERSLDGERSFDELCASGTTGPEPAARA